MERACDFPTFSNRQPSSLSFQCTTRAGAARGSRNDVLVTVQHTETRQVKRRRAQAATDTETSALEPSSLVSSATKIAGHGIAATAGREKEATGRRTASFRETSSIPTGTNLSGRAELDTVANPSEKPAADEANNQLLKCLAALLDREQVPPELLSSNKQRSRSHSPAVGTAARCAQHQPHWREHQQEQVQQWREPHQQEHGWRDYFKHVHEHQGQQFYVEQDQGRSTKKQPLQTQKQLQPPRGRQDSQMERLDWIENTADTIGCPTHAGTAVEPTHILHRRQINSSFRFSCGSMKSTQEGARRRDTWYEQQGVEDSTHNELQKYEQSDQEEEQVKNQQQQEPEQTTDQRLFSSVNCTADAMHLTRAHQERKEPPQKGIHHGRQEEESFQNQLQLTAHCTLVEVDRHESRQPCQPPRYCLQQQHAQPYQAERLQEHELQTQQKQYRLQGVYSHHEPLCRANEYVKCESTKHHAHALRRNVVAAGADGEETKGLRADVASHVHPDDEQQLEMRKRSSFLLAECLPVTAAPAGRSKFSSSLYLPALMGAKPSTAAAARVRADTCGSSAADSASVGRATPTVTTQKPGDPTSSASVRQAPRSGAAVRPSSSATGDTTRGSTTTGPAGRTGAGAAPRRKQLSGAQKRKRKRELMAKCRVEQASLLSFLATTVTSELILNDWYALESQVRDECAYFERLSSSAWTLPGALSPHSSIAIASSPRAAPLSSSDAEDYPIADSDSRQPPNLCFPAPVGCETLDPLALPESQQLQDDFYSQHRQRIGILGPKQQSREQQVEDLTRTHLRGDGACTERTQEYGHLKEERSEAGEFLHQTCGTEAPGKEPCSRINQETIILPVNATDHASRKLHSSAVVNRIGYCIAKVNGASDVLHVESSTSGGGSNTSKELDGSTDAVSSSPEGDVPTPWGCHALVRRCEGFASSNGKSQLLLSGSTTPCSGSSNTTSWDWQTPISSHGTATRSSCGTWTDETEESVENQDAGSTSAIESNAGIRTLARQTTAAAEPESGPLSIFDRVGVEVRPSASRALLPDTVLDADYGTSDADILKRGTASSVHSNSTMVSRGSISSSSREDASVEENSITAVETGCSDSSKIMDSRVGHNSTNGDEQWKLCDIADLQQRAETSDADSVSTVCGAGRIAKPCRLSPLANLVAKACSPGDMRDLECVLTSSQADDWCGKGKSGFPHPSVTCPRISTDVFDTRPQNATNSAPSPVCRTQNRSSAADEVADPLSGGGASENSSPSTSFYGCTWLLHSNQQQRYGQLHTRAHSGPAEPVEGQLLHDLEAVSQLRSNGNSNVKQSIEERGKRAREEAHGTISGTSAATVVKMAEMEGRSVPTQCMAREDPIAASITGTRSSTAGVLTHGESSVRAEAVRLPATWLSRSPAPGPIAQSSRNIVQGPSSSEPGPLTRLLDASEEFTALVVADDEASTASSSPAPVLQQPPAPLLCLHSDCDCETSDNISPCSGYAGAESLRGAGLPPCVDLHPLPEKLQRPPKLVLLPQQSPAQQDKLVYQQQEHSHPKQPTPGSLTPDTRQRYQLMAISPEQQQTSTQGPPIHPRHEARDDRMNPRNPASTPVSEGTPLPVDQEAFRFSCNARRARQQQQQRAFSQEDGDPSLSDPALWPLHMSDALRITLVKRGPVQVVDFDFPRDSTQRRFGRQHYWRTAATGERYWRSWLIYSKSRDAVYCFCCKLYSQLAKSVVSTGFRRWKGAAEVLRSHEQSKDHRTCMLQWKCMCVKVGAEIAFGDLMQLWLPNGPTAAPPVSLESVPESGLVSHAAASALAEAENDALGTVVSHTIEARLRAHSPKREIRHHHATPQPFRIAEANEDSGIVGEARRSSPVCERGTNEDAAKSIDAAGAVPVADWASRGGTDYDTHRTSDTAALRKVEAPDCAKRVSEQSSYMASPVIKGEACNPLRKLDGLDSCSSSDTDLTPSVLNAYYAGDITRTRWLLSEGSANAEKRGMAEA